MTTNMKKIKNPLTGRMIKPSGKTAEKLIKKGTVKLAYTPKKYLQGLSQEKKEKRRLEIYKGSRTPTSDLSAYEPKKFKTDFLNGGKRVPTRKSSYTKEFRKKYPDVKSIKDISKITGIPEYILQKVYDKGMAAWRTGHRPGATQQQWGWARVYSFVLKGKTFYTADASLAREAIQKSKQAEKYFKKI